MDLQFEDLLKKIQSQNNFDYSCLPSEITNFCSFCSTKNISLKDWHRVAMAYYDAKSIENFNQIMDYIIKYEINKPSNNEESKKNQKINIYNSLAAYNLSLAIIQEEPLKAEEYYKLVINYLNQSDKINVEYNFSHSLKVYLHFYTLNLNQAKTYCDNVIEGRLDQKNKANGEKIEKASIIAYLGQAQAEFAQENYKESLEYFKKVLKMNPKIPVKARLGMGYCFFYLKKYDFAKRAFQRILQIDSNNVEAILGLATLAYKLQNFNQYKELLNQAFLIDNCNPLTLLKLTEHYLIQQNYDMVKKLASKGLIALKNFPHCKKQDLQSNDKLSEAQVIRNDYNEIKSRFYFALGHIEHRQEKFDLALKLYNKSVASYKNNIAAQQCLAQIYIHTNYAQYGDALKSLELIHKNNPNEVLKPLFNETYKPLAYLHQKHGSAKQEQINNFYYALKFNPNDYECLIEFASILIENDAKEALENYQKAVQILIQLQDQQQNQMEIENNDEQNKQKQNFIIFPEIYNNMGVLQQIVKKYKESEENFQKAIQISKQIFQKTNDQFKYTCYICTFYYNLGILYMDQNKIVQAQDMFENVIKNNPYYFDAYARQAYLYFMLGDIEKSLKYCDQAKELYDQINSRILRIDIILALKAYILMKTDDTQQARDVYQQIEKNYKISDGYANLALLHSDYEFVVNKRNQATNYDANKKTLSNILDYIKKTLEQDPSNIQAAQVLAIVLAEYGKLNEAKEILINLKEQVGKNNKIMFNLGQIEFLQGHYQQCIQYFKKYLEKETQFDDYAMTCMALAYTLEKNYKEAKNCIKKAIFQNPQSMQHRYNYNMILQIFAEETIQYKKTYSVNQSKQVITYFNSISKLYDYMAHNNQGIQSRIAQIYDPAIKETKKNIYGSLKEKADSQELLIRVNRELYDKYEKEAEEEQYRRQQQHQETKKQYEQIKKKREKEQQELEEQELERKKQEKYLYEKQKEEEQKLLEMIKNQNQIEFDNDNDNEIFSNDQDNKSINDLTSQSIEEEQQNNSQKQQQQQQKKKKRKQSQLYSGQQEEDQQQLSQLSNSSQSGVKKSKKQKVEKKKKKGRLIKNKKSDYQIEKDSESENDIKKKSKINIQDLNQQDELISQDPIEQQLIENINQNSNDKVNNNSDIDNKQKKESLDIFESGNEN